MLANTTPSNTWASLASSQKSQVAPQGQIKAPNVTNPQTVGSSSSPTITTSQPSSSAIALINNGAATAASIPNSAATVVAPTSIAQTMHSSPKSSELTVDSSSETLGHAQAQSSVPLTVNSTLAISSTSTPIGNANAQQPHQNIHLGHGASYQGPKIGNDNGVWIFWIVHNFQLLTSTPLQM